MSVCVHVCNDQGRFYANKGEDPKPKGVQIIMEIMETWKTFKVQEANGAALSCPLLKP